MEVSLTVYIYIYISIIVKRAWACKSTNELLQSHLFLPVAEDESAQRHLSLPLKKGKVFFGQEPPSGEYTTTECGVNYQLLAVIYRSSPMGNSLLQSTTTSYGQ